MRAHRKGPTVGIIPVYDSDFTSKISARTQLSGLLQKGAFRASAVFSTGERDSPDTLTSLVRET